MSNIDKQALNQEKIEWLNKLADMEYCKSNPGHWLMSLKDTNMLAKLALRSVALLDELEAAEKSNEFLKGQLSELANFNPDWDKLEACYESWREIAAELLVAKDRAAEMDDALCQLLPGVQYMDPPDGGSPSLIEQVRRMVADYRERISELEAREVKLPNPHAHLIWIQSGHAPDDYWDDVAVSHSEKDKCCDGSDRYPVYALWEIKEALSAIGINIAAAGKGEAS
ncbi:hypothetical protein [Enterobacter kobei]|uniref:hypothetical protein n=1 Tax=Enterobacter kobei TaxID=208224 RepID=UPI002DBDF189|nr:hypothetical protein [Enterobacter kobei]MEB7605327.1 hypothetical protein [Enterobacter kobei]